MSRIINNYNKGTKEQQLERLHQLMGLTQIKEVKEVPFGTIEKVMRGPDNKTYAIIKENQSFFLKKTDDTKDLKLESFEYLAGSEKLKNLHQYSSYNMADKMLQLEISNIARDLGKKAIILNEKANEEKNLKQTKIAKEVRDDIDRFDEIMKKVSKNGVNNLSEITIDDDETLLTDDTNNNDEESKDDDIINLDNELEDDEESEDDDIINLDDELEDEDIELDKEDIELDKELVNNKIPDLMSKLDIAISKLDAILPELDMNESNNSYDDEDDEDDLDDNRWEDLTWADYDNFSGFHPRNDDEDDEDDEWDEDEMIESIQKTIGADVTTKKPYNYKEKGVSDTKGRNNIPNRKPDGTASIDAFGTDTLNQVKSTIKESVMKYLRENLATSATADEYENVEDGCGRNNLPEINYEGEIDYTNIHTDTLDNVKNLCNQKQCHKDNGVDIRIDFECDDDECDDDEIYEQQNYEWDMNGKNIYEKDTPPRISKIPESVDRFIVNRQGDVYSYITKEGKIVGLNTKAPKQNNANKPFEKKVKILTDMIFKECKKAGIFKKVRS